MDIAALEKALQMGNRGELSYPQLLTRLEQAGAQEYEVDVGIFRCVYKGGGQTYEEDTAEHYPPLVVASKFDAALIKEAFAANHAKPDYKQFLRTIAKAGVVRYVVDIRKRKIAYRGAKAEIYQEDILGS